MLADERLGGLGPRRPSPLPLPRADHLKLLARYADRFARALLAQVQTSGWDEPTASAAARAGHTPLLRLAQECGDRVAAMVQHAAAEKFSWAAADSRHARQHHL